MDAKRGGAALLDTMTATTDRAGYFSRIPGVHRHPDHPAVDAADGFALEFVFRVDAEEHISTHRAGFSLIVITDDGCRGIELGVWPASLWAQADEPLFTRAESAAVDLRSATVRLRLVVVVGATADIAAALAGSGSQRQRADRCGGCRAAAAPAGRPLRR